MRNERDKGIGRLLDANFNRAKEGMRVCEDICRYILDARASTRSYKEIRHRLTAIAGELRIAKLLNTRNVSGDVGVGSSLPEFSRSNTADIFFANSQRVKESLRVLEEFAKLKNKRSAQQLKQLRYRAYTLEQKTSQRL